MVTGGKKKVIIGIMKTLTALCTVLALVLIYILVKRAYFGNPALKNEPENSESYNVVVTDMSAPENNYDPDTVNSTSGFDVKMNAEWTFENGRMPSGDAYVENPSSNVNTVYFDITVPGAEGKIYTSPLLPPGSHIENIAFDRVLPAGKYNGVLTYHLAGADGETEIGALQMALKITVKS